MTGAERLPAMEAQMRAERIAPRSVAPIFEHASATQRPPCPSCGMLLEHTLSGGMLCVWAKCPARREPRFTVTEQGAAALAAPPTEWIDPMQPATDPETETDEQRDVRHLKEDVMHRLAQYPHVSDPEKLLRLSGRDGRLLRILEQMSAQLALSRAAAHQLALDVITLRDAGAPLSNCAFNLAQRESLDPAARASLDTARRAWDAAAVAVYRGFST